ncbi:hypothetical protein ACLB2K_058637 [Fragaria x ananassa]
MSDYLRCRDVCRSWRTTIDSKRCLPAFQLPWLLLDSCCSYYLKDGCFVSDGKLYESRKDRTRYWPGCVGSIEGWLIISALHSSYDLFFLNPVTGTQIVLPSHSAVTKFFKIEAVASSVPSETRLKPRRCYVSCLVFKQKCSLAFCAPGDESWTSIAAEGDDIAVGFRDVEIVDGKLHAVGVRALEFLMVFDIQ